MGVYKAKEGKTKDGRIWFFKLDIKIQMVETNNINQENMLLKKKQKKLSLNLD